MQGDFDIPGYAIEGLIGAGPSGEVWLATDEAGGDKVAIKRVRIDPVDGPDALRRLVATLDALDHDHVLPIRSIAGTDEAPGLITDYAESGSLGHLLAARGHLDPGEVVTIVGPIAEALAAVHGRGLVHGSVTPENILFTQDGRPLLSDTALNQITSVDEGMGGTHGYTDPRVTSSGEPTAAGDVYGLAAVAWAALTGEPPSTDTNRPSLLSVSPGVPPGLAHAIESGLQTQPEVRPGADQLADMVYAATGPAPVRFPVGMVVPDGMSGSDIAEALGGPNPEPAATEDDASAPAVPPAPRAEQSAATPRGRARRRDDDLDDDGDDETPRRGGGGISRTVVVGIGSGVGVVVLAAAVVFGFWWSGRDDDPAPPPGTTTAATGQQTQDPAPPESTPPAKPQPKGDNWKAILSWLFDLRAEAFRTGDTTRLDYVFVPGSAQLAKDRGAIDTLVQANAHIPDYRLTIKSVTPAKVTSRQVRLDTVTQQQPYKVVDEAGNEQEYEGHDPFAQEIVLVKQDGRWIIKKW